MLWFGIAWNIIHKCVIYNSDFYDNCSKILLHGQQANEILQQFFKLFLADL